MLHLCMARLGVTPDEAIYVGDQETDAQAASAAGMRFVAMAPDWAGDGHRIDSLAELVSLVPRL